MQRVETITLLQIKKMRASRLSGELDIQTVVLLGFLKGIGYVSYIPGR